MTRPSRQHAGGRFGRRALLLAKRPSALGPDVIGLSIVTMIFVCAQARISSLLN
jgi:hypothetical protein